MKRSVEPGNNFCVRIIDDAALQWQLFAVNALRAGADAYDIRIGFVVQIDFNISTPISEKKLNANSTAMDATNLTYFLQLNFEKWKYVMPRWM